MALSKSLLLAGVAAIALAACGKKDEGGAPATKSSAAAAQASAASPLDKPYKLKGGEEVDVDALLSLIPEPARPTYESAAFDSAIGATVVTNLRFIDRDADDGVEIDGLKIERAELFGVDMDAIYKVKGGTAAVDAPFHKIFDKVRLYGVSPIEDSTPANANDEDGDTDVRIGAVEFDQFRLREGGVPEDEESDNPAFFFNSFDLGGLYFKDFNLAGADDADSEIGMIAPDLRIVGIGGGKIGAIIANDLRYDVVQSEAARSALAQQMGGPAGAILSGPLKGFVSPDRQRTHVDAFEWRAIDFSGLMGYGLKNEKPPVTAKNLINLGALKATDMEFFIGEKRAATVDLWETDTMEFTWVAPSKIRSVTKGATYDFTAYVPDTETKAIETLKKHGLNAVSGEGDLTWDWDPNKGGAKFATGFTAPKLADFDMDFSLAGLELSKISAAMEAGEEGAFFKNGSFAGFGMKLTERKLLDAVYDMAALQMGGTGEELRASTPAMVRLSGMQAATIHPKFADYVSAVASFLEDGGTLEVAARPKQPVPFETLMSEGASNPQTIPDTLALTVTHKK